MNTAAPIPIWRAAATCAASPLLPTGLGQGLYGLLGYEAGEVWSPEQRAFLRQDGTVGLVGNTPIGLVTFGVSIGDAGHRKVFLTLGRWF